MRGLAVRCDEVRHLHDFILLVILDHIHLLDDMRPKSSARRTSPQVFLELLPSLLFDEKLMSDNETTA